jgi:AsmA protein
MLKNAAQTLRRHAGRPFGRVLLLSFAALIVLAVVFRVVTPFLISTTIVRESMERAVAQWTGHGATIGGVSTIRFWPHPEVTLSDITIHRDGREGGDVLATIGMLSASFELTEALLGHPVFTDFHLSAPHVFVSRGIDGRLRWAKDGLLIDAMENSRQNGNRQTLDAALDAPVGDVHVSNGVIEIVDEAGGQATRFDAINGTLEWPNLSDMAEIEAVAEYRGRRIRFDVRSSQPLLLLDGRSGRLQGTVTADIGLARFNGLATLTNRGYFSGNAELQVSDMPAMLEWLHIDPDLADGLTSASVVAKVMADRDELRFEELSLGLNEEHATGLLELDTPATGRPRLSGTLAFDRIDFLRLLAALEPAISNDGQDLPSLVSGLDLDLRLSSRVAKFATMQIQNIALGLMNVDQQFRLDILEGDLQPGRLTGRISTIKENSGEAVAFRMSVRDADFAAMAQQFNLAGPMLATRGTLDLSLDVPRPISRDAWNAATGTVQFNSGSGRLEGINMATVRRLSTEKPYFALGEAADGSIEFDSINATAAIHDGIADIRQADIAGKNEAISLTGAVPLINRSFALSVLVKPNNPADQALSFFVGGAWPTPVLWPTAAPAPRAGQ